MLCPQHVTMCNSHHVPRMPACCCLLATLPPKAMPADTGCTVVKQAGELDSVVIKGPTSELWRAVADTCAILRITRWPSLQNRQQTNRHCCLGTTTLKQHAASQWTSTVLHAMHSGPVCSIANAPISTRYEYIASYLLLHGAVRAQVVHSRPTSLVQGQHTCQQDTSLAAPCQCLKPTLIAGSMRPCSWSAPGSIRHWARHTRCLVGVK
jgi:hypothetical protein